MMTGSNTVTGIAFTGHRNDCPDVQDVPNGNHGNFLALLNFRIQAGDRVLEEHLKNSASNASKTVQNELIVIFGDIVRNKILAKVQQAKYFIADEATDVATDVATDEQLSICICYVEEDKRKSKTSGPDPTGGAYSAPPDPLAVTGGGTPLPVPSPTLHQLEYAIARDGSFWPGKYISLINLLKASLVYAADSAEVT
ncbi:hypothetical protein EMCRGX_G012868 [Ephydatia muelleri]